MPTKTPPKPDTTTRVSPAELNTYHRNARRGDIPAIARSLTKLKQYKPLTGNIGTHTGRPFEILAGNHTLMAIRQLHDKNPSDPAWQKVKVHWVDVDDELANDINLADNRTAELGGYDNAELLAQIRDVPSVDLSSLGFDADYIADLEKLVEDAAIDFDGEGGGRGNGEKLALWGSTVGEPDVKPEPGSVWQMGHHTVIVVSLHKDWPTWITHLREGMIFAPYPSLLLPYVDVARATPMLMVQPDPFIAGWMLTKWNRVNPTQQAVPL